MKNKKYKSIFFKDENLPFVEARFVVDSDYHYNRHFHETLSIGAVEYGKVEYKHLNNIFTLKPDELSTINPYEVHSCNPLKDQSRTYHMIYIDKSWCKNIQESLFGTLESFIDMPIAKIENKALFEKYIKLNNLLLNKSAFYLEKEELLQEFLVELFSKYCDVELEIRNNISNISKKVLIAKEYIKNNIRNDITLENISKELNISQFHLIKIFKAEIFMTPHAFLLNEKITEAKKLLSQNIDLAQIAYELGFSDQSHLNRVFKKFVAATPIEYKGKQ